MKFQCKKEIHDTKEILLFRVDSEHEGELSKDDTLQIKDMTGCMRRLPKAYWKEHFKIIE